MGKYYLGTGNQQINFQVVDSTGVINDLNLSGLYLSITGKAADADKLDNYDSSFFRNAANLTGVYTGLVSGKAADSELLDGLDSSYFLNGANITGTVQLSGTFTGYYTGAFSGTITHTDYIQFHTGLGINPDPAELTWSDDVGTMQLGLDANVDLRVGFQNYEFVTNRNASTLSKGSVVYISGAQGNRPAVALALANADSTSAVTFGILAEDIASMADGYAITNGLLTNLNTTGFAEGVALYLSPTVSGAIISTKPQAPQHSVLVGFCVRSHASAGEILVKIQNGLEIDELHDVRILNKQNNDIIRYHAPSGVWYNSDTLAINGTGANYISGDLGIGTSGPTAKLHILGADKKQIIASTTDNAALVLGQWDGATNRIESSTRKLLITSYASGISLGINGSENVHVSTSGYLGIGTTSPLTTLNLSISGGNGPVYQTFTDTTNAYHHGYVGKNGGGLVFGFSSQNGSFSADEKMRITTSGNVGIGVTAPDVKLEVSGDVSIRSANYLYFGQYTNSIGSWATRMYALGGYHYFNANGFIFSNEGYSATEWMRITTAGNVGIGTTSPSSKLDVNGASTFRDTINVGPNVGTISWGSMGGGTGFGIRGESGRALSLGSNGNWDYIVINTSGNVGIGTTNPTNKLEIATGNSATTGIRVRDSANGVWTDIYRATIKFFGGGGVIDTNDTTDAIDIRQAGNSRLFIAQSNSTYNGVSVGGWVGIGTSAPSQRLEVLGDLDMAGLKVTTTTGRGRITVASQTISYSSYLELNSGESQIAFLDGNYNSNRLRIATNRTGAYIAFETDAQSEKMRITSAGNVGVGTTSPADLLNIQGTNKNIRVTNTAAYNASGTAYLGFNGYYNSSNADAWFARIVSGKENTTDNDARGYLSIQTNNPSSGIADRVRITSDGYVGIGATSPKTMLDVYNNSDIWHFMVGGGTSKLLVGGQAAGGVVLQGGAANTANNAAVSSAYNILLQRDGGNVGIGNAAASYKLHIGDNTATASAHMMLDGVFGNTTAASHARIYFNDTNFGIGAGGWASSGSDDDLYLWTFDGTGRDIRFAKTSDGTSAVNTANWTTNMIIKNDGSVGIGTTTPYDKLEVAGGIAATGYTTGSASQAHATLIGVNGGTSYLQAVDWGAEYKPLNIEGKTISLQTGTGSTSSRFYIDNSGNVGIGSTSPNQKLEIKGGNVRIDNRAAGSYSAPDLEFLSGDSSGSWNVFKIRYTKNASLDRLEFIDGGNSNAFIIANGGNVTALGNLNVQGSGTSTINNLSIAPTSGHVYLTGPSAAGKFITLQNGNATGGINFRDSAGNEVGSYYQVTDAWIFSKNTTVSGNLTVSQNLIVNGTTTTINSTVTTIDDPIITLGGDTAPTTDDNKDRGIEFKWHNGTAAKVGFFGFDDSTGYFTFIPDATNSSEVFSGAAGTIAGYFYGSADQAFTNQHNGNASQWYGRILSRNSTSDKAAFLGTYSGSVAGVFAHNNALNAWTDLYVNTTDGSTGGTVKMPSTVLVNGNQVLHAGNYNSYALPLTGGTLTGPITESSTTDQAVTLNATDNSWKYIGFSWSGTRKTYFGINASGSPEWGSDVANTTFAIVGSGSSLTIAGNTVWHAGNDGSGSGLDADLLDGYNQDTANTANTIVRRDASGNFSAGTITGTRLEARNSGTTQIYIDSTNNGSKEIVFQNNGATTGYLWQASTYVGLGGGSGSNSLFVTTSNGNVGVGTTSPIAKLTVSKGITNSISTADSSNTSHLTLAGSDSLVRLQLGVGGATYNYAGWIQASYDNTGGANGIEPLLLNPIGGNVGIGTTSPNLKLEVYDSVNTAGGIRINNPNSGTGAHSSLSFANSNSSNGAGVVLFGGSWTTSNLYRQDGMYIYTNRNGGMTLAVETANPIYFATNNIERVRIDSSGNVGIGTTAPAYRTEIAGAAAAYWNGSAFNAGPLALAITNSYAGGYDPVLMFRQANSASGLADSGSIGMQGKSSWTSGNNASQISDMYFLIRNNAATLVERMRITYDGNVGIGTSSPSAKLDISGDSVQNVGLVRFTNSYASGNVYYPTASFIQTRGNHSYGIVSEFRTNTAADSDRPSILFYAAQAAHSWQVGQVTSGWGTSDNFGIGYRASNTPGSFSAWPTNYFTITTGGNVGIGTTGPNAKLQIAGTSTGILTVGTLTNNWGGVVAIGTIDGNGIILSKVNAANDSNRVLTLVRDDTNGANITGYKPNGTSADIGFVIRANAKSYFDGGNVGIGTTDPAEKLHVNAGNAYISYGTDTATYNAGAFNASPRLALLCKSATSAYNLIRYTAGGSHEWAVGSVHTAAGTADYIFQSYNGSSYGERVRINASGNVGIGSTAPSSKLDVALTSDTSGEPTAWDNKYAVFGVGASSTASGIFISYDQTNNRGYIGALTPGTAWRNLILQPNATNGNVGIGTKTPGYRLEVNGSFAATTKSFVIKHPTKEGKKLRYGSLEGPENGVYVRGKTTSKVIELPDYWTKLVDPESITVQLTPIGSHQKLYVEKIEDNKVYIANENLLAKNINCFFYILAERADVEKLQVEIDA